MSGNGDEDGEDDALCIHQRTKCADTLPLSPILLSEDIRRTAHSQKEKYVT